MAHHSHPLVYIRNVIPLRPAARIPAGLHARATARSVAVERWENEGGHFLEYGDDRQSAPRLPITSELTRLTAQVRRMADGLFSDFANGVVGTRGFAHRSRVLRQLISRRDAMRETGGPEQSR